ncbi:MAG: hypothetical protein ABJC09_16310 [Terriglobia bacterium]
MRVISALLLIAGTMSLASADVIKLRSGEAIQGTYLGGTARQIRVDVNGNIQTYDVNTVSSVSFREPEYQPQPPPRQPESAGYERPRQESPRQESPQGISIPADTSVTIRMIESVNSDSSRLGQTFRASLDEPIYVDGQQIVPRGADVLTKLVDDQQSGKFQGRTVLTLALASITIKGRPVDVTSTDVKTTSDSRGAKTAKTVGGGSALGAIVGAIAGGGTGAAIGAASGAALGGGVQAVTSGQKVKIPSETRLIFRLQAPVQL